jgi:hypothetical protein
MHANSRPALMKFLRTFLLLLLLPGCGKELMAGGFRDVEVVATDRHGDPSGTPAGARSWSAPRSFAQPPTSTLDGTISVRARAFLIRSTGERLSIGDAPVDVNLTIAASERSTLGRQAVPAESYAAILIEFEQVEAVLATEVPGLAGTIRLGIGGPIDIEKEILLVSGSREDVLIEVNLDASAWALPTLTEAQRREAFESNLQVRVVQ